MRSTSARRSCTCPACWRPSRRDCSSPRPGRPRPTARAAAESRSTTASVRLEARTFWEVFTFLLESALFVLVGLQGRALFEGLSAPTSELVVAALALIAVVVVVRLLVALLLHRLPVRERLVVGWAGMRGAISLAAAL